MNPAWYLQRLIRMSPRELVGRVRDAGLRRSWQRLQADSVEADEIAKPVITPSFDTPLPPGSKEQIPDEASAALIETAEQLLEGNWRVFDVEWHDFNENPDWFLDIKTGIRAPSRTYAFSIQHRDEARVGNIKYVWEPSRHHPITVLASAYYLTGDERYAKRAASHLTSWWQANPFLSGIHWSSGIEIGLRLVSWVWTRRLLDGWSGVGDLFDNNPHFLKQLYRHQFYLAHLKSHGSSANNHLFLEETGLFVSTCAFPWFKETQQWRGRAAKALQRELELQTFADGHNREQASDYHGFVLEAALVAAIEGEAAGHSLGPNYWASLRAMTDTLATIVDCKGHVPRQGDSDDGIGLLLDDPAYDRWSSLLNTGAQLFGALPWWPQNTAQDIRTPLWTALIGNIGIAPLDRAQTRPDLLPQAGMALLRDEPGRTDEIWCRCDHGPHGYLSIASHAHADALSIELRYGGVDIFIDPGTYCYHGDPKWRDYFRSTRAHNTIELAGCDQSLQAGPFMWRSKASSTLQTFEKLENGSKLRWQASHDGYKHLPDPTIHHREVVLDRANRSLTITDWLDGKSSHPSRMFWHLGPEVDCVLDGALAHLCWPQGKAVLTLPEQLSWRLAKGEHSPPLGWYSPCFDKKGFACSLVGYGNMKGKEKIITFILLETLPVESKD